MQNTITKEDTVELVQRCGKGDPEAIKLFFEIYSSDIYNFPLKVFHLSEDDAGDFYIYAFERLKTGKRLQSFEGKSSFKTWFYAVLRNLLIDWKRTKREVVTQSATKQNKDGEEYTGIEDEPDTLAEQKKEAVVLTSAFYQVLKEIKLESRVIFKLSFIYYLQLDEDEIQYILTKTGISLDSLKEWIIQTRDELSNKEESIQKMEDKITSIYLNILDLKKSKLAEDLTLESTSNLPDIDLLGKSLNKKYEQRKKLLEKRQKGHFLARTPYKNVRKLMGLSEGGVSVTLIRVIEKLQKKINLEDFS